MELRKQMIRTNEIGKMIIDQFFIDEDYNVPDSKYDVGRIVQSDGKVQIEDVKPSENYLKVSGKLYFHILYVTDEGEPKLASLEGKQPFEEMVYIESGADGNYIVRDSRVEFTVSLIHSRKLSIKTMVELQVHSEKMAEEEMTTDVESDRMLYKRQAPVTLLQINSAKKDTYRIKEEMGIPGTKETIGTLLFTDVADRKLDTKLGPDELLLTGELLVFCFYESMEGKIDWVEQVVPYEGRVECYGADQSMFHHVYAKLEDVAVEPRMDEDGEMRILGVEGTLDLRVAVYEEEQLELLKDVYSLETQCTLETRESCYEELMMQNHSKCKVAEQLSLPELKDDILQICHSSGKLQVDRMDVTEAGIEIEGVLHVNFLYVKSNDEVPFDTWQGMVPFSYLMESNETCDDMRYDMTSAVEQLSVTMMGNDEIEVKAVLAFNSFLRRPVKTDVITGIQMEPYSLEEIEKRPGITGYLVKSGDDLWSLAKRYCTTVEGIMEVNDLDGENIKEGDKILIFKENMSIL